MDTLPNQNANQPVLGVTGEVAPQSPEFDFWALLNRRKGLVFLGLLVGLGLGYLYHTRAEVIFESSAKILIQPKSSVSVIDDRNGNMVPLAEEYTESHDMIIASEQFVRKTLVETPESAKWKIFRGMNLGERVEFVTDENNLTVVPDSRDPNFFYITFRSGYKEDCRLVVNALVSQYEKTLAEKYTDRSEEVVDLFQRVRQDLLTDFTKAQDKYTDIEKEFNAIRIIDNGNGVPQTIHQIKVRDLDREITELTTELQQKQEEGKLLAAAISEDKTLTPEELVWLQKQQGKLREETTDTRRADEAYENLREVRMERDDLAAKYGSNHPLMQAANRRVEELEKYLQEGAAADESNNGNAILPAQEKIRRLKLSNDLEVSNLESQLQYKQSQMEHHTSRAIELERVNGRLRRQQTEIDTIKGWLDEAMTKARQLEMSGQFDKSQGFFFQTLTEAKTGFMVWPNLLAILGVSGFLGSLLGLGLGYLVDIADQTFRSPEEITRQLGLSLIGHIPVMSNSRRHKTSGSQIDVSVSCVHRPKSQAAEAFRAVRTALYFNTERRESSVIQVTSPTPGDGKSTIGANLAVTIAQSGKRVLLVDGDMRRPTIHKLFGIRTQDGFAPALAGQISWEEAVIPCEEVEGLSLLPCGARPANPAELITSPSLTRILEEMRDVYDFVIVDTPPVLVVTDPCPIAAQVDGVVLALRIKKNVKVSAERATEVLASVGANVIGLVVNGVGAQSGYGSQYSYGAYRSGYSYGSYGGGIDYGANTYYEDEQVGRRPKRKVRRIDGPTQHAHEK